MEKSPVGANSSRTPSKNETAQTLSTSLDETLSLFRRIFNNDGTLKIRVINNMHCDKVRCGLIYIDGMIDRELVQEGIIRPVTSFDFTTVDISKPAELMERIRTQVVSISDVIVSTNLEELISAVVAGKTLLLLDGYGGGLNLNAQGWEMRAITEPTTDKAVRGPREGFTESLLVNLTLIRRRMQTTTMELSK